MSNQRDLTAIIGAIAFASFGAMPRAAPAEEILKYRIVAHSTGLVTIDAADGIDGHIYGAAKFVGMVFMDDGRIGSIAHLANFDYIKGNGSYSAFQTLTFDDGSILRLKNTGSGATELGKTIFNDGTTEVLGGGGKYKGATGSGEFTGKRILPTADGGDVYFDGTIHLR
jgi:hypothetical protein